VLDVDETFVENITELLVATFVKLSERYVPVPALVGVFGTHDQGVEVPFGAGELEILNINQLSGLLWDLWNFRGFNFILFIFFLVGGHTFINWGNFCFWLCILFRLLRQSCFLDFFFFLRSLFLLGLSLAGDSD
jgi:hypothetical protein